jgi:hypothetical protein
MENMKRIMAGMMFVGMLASCDKNSSRKDRVERCYERVTSGNGITDQLTLQVEFDSDSISGRLDWLPQEKDSQRGTIKGIRVSDEKYSVYYDYTAEGVKNTEKQTIVFENKFAIITREHDSSSGVDAFLSTDTLKLRQCSSVENSN